MKDNDTDIDKAIEGFMKIYEFLSNSDISLPDGESYEVENRAIYHQLVNGDDKVKVQIDAGEEIDKLHINEEGDELIVEVKDEKISKEIEDDLDLSNAEANMNNGVMDLIIPKDNNVEIDVQNKDEKLDEEDE